MHKWKDIPRRQHCNFKVGPVSVIRNGDVFEFSSNIQTEIFVCHDVKVCEICKQEMIDGKEPEFSCDEYHIKEVMDE
jgi:hypothetical protein